MKKAQIEAFLQQLQTANENFDEVIKMLDTTWWDRLFEPTTVIALIVAIFSFAQLKIASKQRRQEMFEKRWDLYTRVFDLFYRKQVLKEKIEPVTLLPYANEANFLFDKKVAKHIMSIANYSEENIDYDWLNKPFRKYMRIK